MYAKPFEITFNDDKTTGTFQEIHTSKYKVFKDNFYALFFEIFGGFFFIYKGFFFILFIILTFIFGLYSFFILCGINVVLLFIPSYRISYRTKLASILINKKEIKKIKLKNVNKKRLVFYYKGLYLDYFMSGDFSKKVESIKSKPIFSKSDIFELELLFSEIPIYSNADDFMKMAYY